MDVAKEGPPRLPGDEPLNDPEAAEAELPGLGDSDLGVERDRPLLGRRCSLSLSLIMDAAMWTRMCSVFRDKTLFDLRHKATNANFDPG